MSRSLVRATSESGAVAAAAAAPSGRHKRSRSENPNEDPRNHDDKVVYDDETDFQARLPQDATNPEKRADELAEQRKDYSWIFLPPNPFPFVPTVPVPERTEFNARIRKTRYTDLFSTASSFNLNNLWKKLVRYYDYNPVSGGCSAFEKYERIFFGTGLTCPDIAKDWQLDEVFAWQKLNGCNPKLIQRLGVGSTASSGRGGRSTPAPGHNPMPAKFPVTDDLVGKLLPPGESLGSLAAQGRLFVCDYQLLENIRHPEKRVVTAPLCLFFTHPQTGVLLPLAIQLSQTPSATSPIFTPLDPPNVWLAAKCFVNCADSAVHETQQHYFVTHLISEAVSLSMKRHLHVTHPLRQWLDQNFKVLPQLHFDARRDLIGPRGVVPLLMAVGADGLADVFYAAAQNVDFPALDIDEDIKRRGVDNTATLPQYHWRTDALRVNAIIKRFVNSVIETFYPSDRAVADDFEVQNWFAEMQRPLGITGLGIKNLPTPNSRAHLATVVSVFLYNVVAGHAAVNNPQFELMAFVPNMPGVFNLDIPTSKSATIAIDDIVAAMPSINASALAISYVYALTKIDDTRFGAYEGPMLFNRQVRLAVDRLQSDLKDLSTAIQSENEKDPQRKGRPYKFLDPAQLDQGTLA